MRNRGRSLGYSGSILIALCFYHTAPGALAQLSPSYDTGVVADDLLTLVVGTRFVRPTPSATPKAQFNDARIPISSFGETDHCIDQRALEVATDYFNTLGRLLGKAGFYYAVPTDEIRKLASDCEKLHGRPPEAWIDSQTEIIAFGRVVPTADAPALEQSLR